MLGWKWCCVNLGKICISNRLICLYSFLCFVCFPHWGRTSTVNVQSHTCTSMTECFVRMYLQHRCYSACACRCIWSQLSETNTTFPPASWYSFVPTTTWIFQLTQTAVQKLQMFEEMSQQQPVAGGDIFLWMEWHPFVGFFSMALNRTSGGIW